VLCSGHEPRGGKIILEKAISRLPVRQSLREADTPLRDELAIQDHLLLAKIEDCAPSQVTELARSSPYGVTAGAGIEAHLWRLAIAPSVRYTHWGRNSPSVGGPYAPFQNQVAVLAGFSFSTGSLSPSTL
jgi:hypothetical protein